MSIVDVKKYEVTHLVIRDDEIEQILVEFLLAKFDFSIWLADTRSRSFSCTSRAPPRHESWQIGIPTSLLAYSHVLLMVDPTYVGAEGRG
jgi:hypothetical protein